MPYRVPAEMPPPDPPEPRVIPPPNRAEKINFYILLFFGFTNVIHVIGAVAIVFGKEPEFPWHQVGQVFFWTWYCRSNYIDWRKARQARLRGV